MADMPALMPQDFDPWRLATPLQLLTLLERLDVPMTEVARWLHVPKSSVSMWRHGTRAFPPKHFPTLLERTQRTVATQAELTDKAVSLAPTAELQAALRAEFEAVWNRWKSEVLSEAGTLRRTLQANTQTLVQGLTAQPFGADALAQLDQVWGVVRQQVALLMTLEGVAPDPEEALLRRLTAAQEATRQEKQ